MGRKVDFSPEEIRFFVQCFERGWTDKAIEQDIQDTTEYSVRPARTIGKIRKIYEDMKEPVMEVCREKIKKELALNRL